MFSSPTDIANRALIPLGNPIIGNLGENSKAAITINAIYDKLRQAELNAHVWRYAVRRVACRPVTATTKLITFPTYAAGTAYQQADIVNDPTANAGNSGTALYLSLVASNTGNTPSSSPTKWTPYFGPDICDGYSASDTYSLGELVFVTTNIYLSAANGNINNTPSSGAPWSAAALTGATGATLFIPYPIGQFNSGATRTTYRLPVGFMRIAPQDAKIAGGSFQTSSAGMQYSDIEFEGNYFLSSVVPQVSTAGPYILRFVGDISDVTQMTPQFAESLAMRIAFEACESLTGKKDLKDQIGASYTKTIQSARRDNMLEQGSTDPEEADYLTARVPSVVMAPAPQRG